MNVWITTVDDSAENANPRPGIGALLAEHRAVILRQLVAGLPAPLADQADDLFQEVSCDAVRQWPQYQWNGPRAFRAWLEQIAAGKLADWWRRFARRRETTAGGDEQQTSLAAAPAPGPTPSSVAGRREEHALLDAFLDTLTALEAEVLRLRFRDDLAWDEIAARVGKSVGAAKMTAQRAIQQLAELARRTPPWEGP